MFGKGHRVIMTVDDVRMDSKSFAKLMKEAGVLHGKLNLTRVDLCFTKCCDKVSQIATSQTVFLHSMPVVLLGATMFADKQAYVL